MSSLFTLYTITVWSMWGFIIFLRRRHFRLDCSLRRNWQLLWASYYSFYFTITVCVGAGVVWPVWKEIEKIIKMLLTPNVHRDYTVSEVGKAQCTSANALEMSIKLSPDLPVSEHSTLIVILGSKVIVTSYSSTNINVWLYPWDSDWNQRQILIVCKW